MIFSLPAILLAILSSASALPAHLSSHPSSSLLSREDSNTTVDGDTTVTNFDLKSNKVPSPFLIGDTPPTICATPGREQNYTTEEILVRMSDFAKSYPSSDNGFFAPTPEFPDINSTTTGIDPNIPATYAEGCATDAAFFWTSMSGNSTRRTDIVVFNYDPEGFTVAFCGVMTNADEDENDTQYHLCNRQPGTEDDRLSGPA